MQIFYCAENPFEFEFQIGMNLKSSSCSGISYLTLIFTSFKTFIGGRRGLFRCEIVCQEIVGGGIVFL